jgi:hypothetical protein
MAGLLATEVPFSIDNHLAGANMLDAANDRLVIPVGGSGLYQCIADLSASGLGLGNDARVRYTVGGTPQAASGVMVGMGAGLSSWLSISAIFNMGDNGTIGINVLPHATDNADYQLRRLIIVRMANAYGSTVSGLFKSPEDGNVASDEL